MHPLEANYKDCSNSFALRFSSPFSHLSLSENDLQEQFEVPLLWLFRWLRLYLSCGPVPGFSWLIGFPLPPVTLEVRLRQLGGEPGYNVDGFQKSKER